MTQLEQRGRFYDATRKNPSVWAGGGGGEFVRTEFSRRWESFEEGGGGGEKRKKGKKISRMCTLTHTHAHTCTHMFGGLLIGKVALNAR